MNDLDAVLSRTIELLACSRETCFSTRSVVSLKKSVERQLAKLEHGRSPRALSVRFALVDLFAPAGDIQEVSMANGWADEFLRLSEVVDRSIKPEPG